LSADELQDLALAGQEDRAQKCSTRELSLILAKQQQQQQQQQQQLYYHPYQSSTGATNQTPFQWGATTVASTMTLAHAAGISSFVTGGIGGVHRNGQVSMDVSADLTELSRTPVVVISAGIKSILDIPRTLEVLETNGVPTVAYQTDEFPCFFSPNSGISSPARVDSAGEVAAAYWAARDLDLSHGMLVAVPPPNSAGESIEQAIQAALQQANEQGLTGQAVTPFILKKVAETTGGDSLRCNISLVQHNAEIGSEIAVAIAEQKNATAVGVIADPIPDLPRPSRIIVMGGAALDIVAKPTSGELLLGTSNPATCSESDGGVARNIAEVLGRLGSSPLLYSAVGKDDRGQALKRRLEEYGILDSEMTVRSAEGSNTATYLAILEGGTYDLHTACADWAVMNEIQPPPLEILTQAKMLLVDANPPMDVLIATAKAACEAGVDVFFEPTSVPKTISAAQEPEFLRCLAGAFPNLDELIAMRNAACGIDTSTYPNMIDKDDLEDDDIMDLADELLEFMAKDAFLVVTLGERGVCLVSSNDDDDNCIIPVDSVTEPVNVQNCTGAGDTLCGAFLHAILQGRSKEDAVVWGMKAAAISLSSSERTISPDLSNLKL